MFTSAASKLASGVSQVAGTVSGTVSFTEHQVMKHAKALTGLGSHSTAQEYVVKEMQNIKETSKGGANVEVEVLTPAKSGLKGVALKVSPKDVPDADNHAILVSCDLNAATKGKEDEASSVGLMVELARDFIITSGDHAFKNPVLFFVNFDEEEYLGCHNIEAQNALDARIRLAVDLQRIAAATYRDQPDTVLFDGDNDVRKVMSLLQFLHRTDPSNSSRNVFTVDPIAQLIEYNVGSAMKKDGRFHEFDDKHHAAVSGAAGFTADPLSQLVEHEMDSAMKKDGGFYESDDKDDAVFKDTKPMKNLGFMSLGRSKEGAPVFMKKKDDDFFEPPKPRSTVNLGENVLSFLIGAAKSEKLA